jgi:putative transposase
MRFGLPTSYTYLPTWHGFLYLAAIIDAWSRCVVGWSMATHLKTELVLDALEMALWNRRPAPGLIHHSDHGCQYASLAFGRRCREAGIAASMGTVGDCFDNAMCESFFASLECELIDRRRPGGWDGAGCQCAARHSLNIARCAGAAGAAG